MASTRHRAKLVYLYYTEARIYGLPTPPTVYEMLQKAMNGDPSALERVQGVMDILGRHTLEELERALPEEVG